MANWIAIIDSDKTRRLDAFARVDASISPFPNLATRTMTGDGWTVAWAASQVAPIDFATANDCTTIVWGEARDSNGKMCSAGEIQTGWARTDKQQWDGYYSALVIDAAKRSLIAGVDVLGYYPLYYWSDGDGVVLVGTSPGLFTAHPAFVAELNLRGLIGIFLTNGLVDGECLWRGVRRAAPGHLVCVANGQVSEEKIYEVPLDADADDLPFEGHLQMFDAELAASIRRQIPADESCGLMLSGGLDSRLLAGYLGRKGSAVDCLTFGLSPDFEMRCARYVAQHLGFSHHAYEVPYSDYAAAAERCARFDLLSSGFSGVMEWAIQQPVADVSERILVGHAFDGVIGGIHVGWAYDSSSRSMGFDELLPTVLAWGVDPSELEALLDPEVAPLVAEVMQDLREEYFSIAQREHHRAWLFDLYHRQRFHVAGSIWPISFGAWPVSPIFDKSLLAACSALPGTSIADRRMQIELLKQGFPELAALPLDRNSLDMMPMVPQLTDYLKRSLHYRLAALQESIRGFLGLDEPNVLYFKRIYDFDSPGWQSIRALSQDKKQEVGALFPGANLDDLIPPPDVAVQDNRTLKQTSQQRNAAGLALCLRQAATET